MIPFMDLMEVCHLHGGGMWLLLMHTFTLSLGRFLASRFFICSVKAFCLPKPSLLASLELHVYATFLTKVER